MSESIKRWFVGGAVSVGLLAQISVADAGPVTVQDQYGVASDVIGSLADFDINKIVFTSLTSTNITVELYLNFHNTTLADWSFSGLTLSVGDLMFDVNNVYKYGVTLKNHDGLIAGRLYSATHFWTSDEKMAGSGVTYRTGQLVQVQTGTDITGPGGANAPVIEDLAGTQLKVTLSFDPNDPFWTDLSTSGLSVHFASATCANDVIDG